jgi:hypothetical protein
MSSVVDRVFTRFIDSMTTDIAPPRNQHASQSAGDPEQSRSQIGWTRKSKQEKVSDAVAEDHARLLTMVGRCLAEIGIKASLTTFHNLVLYGEIFELPSRYEPELDVFWPGERPGVALRVKLTERSGQDFYAWGVSWAYSHPASDPVGAVQLIANAVLAA